MSAHVSYLEVHSSLGRVTLTMDRNYTVRSVPESTDLPDDMRRALLYWLGVKQLPETMHQNRAGYRDCRLERDFDPGSHDFPQFPTDAQVEAATDALANVPGITYGVARPVVERLAVRALFAAKEAE